MNRSLETLYDELGSRVMTHILAEKYMGIVAIKARGFNPAKVVRKAIIPIASGGYDFSRGALEVDNVEDMIGRIVQFEGKDTNFYRVDRISKKGNLVTSKNWIPNKGKVRVGKVKQVCSVLSVIGGASK